VSTPKKKGTAPPARYRRVYARLWDDLRFRGLSHLYQLVVLYLLTGSMTNRIGYFLMSPGLAAETLNMDVADFKAALESACDAFGWRYDNAARVLYMPFWWKDNPPESANHLTGNLKDLSEVPHSDLLKEFVANTGTLHTSLHEAFREGVAKALGEPYPHGSPDGSTKGSRKRSLKGSSKPSTNPPGTSSGNGSCNGNGTRESGAGEVDELARAALDLFAESWQRKYGRQVDEPSPAQRDALREVAAENGIDGFRDGVSGYFEAFDDFVIEAKHPLGLFLKQFGRWAAESSGAIQ
jgi:hypothetical protein